MEAAIRSSVQVGGPSPGQRATDTGPSSQQTQSGPPPQLSYQQRIPSGASPIHRPVDTPQSYSKGGVGPPPPQQPTSRSAASPLSPPRPGPGAANTYPRFADVTAVREAPHRYVQQSAYGGGGQVQQFRENPYARIPQVPAQVQDYHRAATSTVLSTTSNLPVVSIGPANTMDGLPGQGAPTTVRQRISLIPPPPQQSQQHQQQPPSQQQSQQQQQQPAPPQQQPQHPSEYITQVATRPPAQAPPDPGGQPFKKMRLNEAANHIPSAPAPTPPSQQLKVDTREHRPATTEAYHPQVEAISPTLPNESVEERRITKDDLLMQIHKVDIEIGNAESTMIMLKKKEEQLEQASQRPSKVEESTEVQPKHRSLAQKIYSENHKKAHWQNCELAKFGPPVELPFYNQPSDVKVCQDIIQRHQTFKSRLLMHLKKIKQERAAKNAALIEKYAQLSQEWLKRVEKAESSAKRKAKEAKNREFFEKVFTELRKQREDKERFNRVGSRIKSEADLEEIMDGLQEQAMEDKKMRSYAVIPPLMLDARQRKYVYHNENGLLSDMTLEYKERQNLNVWTAGEKELFKEKFLQHPKNFGAIAASLDRKSAQDCVRYYYLSKKTENYKQLLRKSRQRTRSSRNPQKSQQAQSQCIVDSLTTGVTTRLQREQQQKTGGRDRAAQSTTSTTSAATTTVTTSTAATSSSSGIAGSTTTTTTIASTVSSNSSGLSSIAGMVTTVSSSSITTIAGTAPSATTTINSISAVSATSSTTTTTTTTIATSSIAGGSGLTVNTSSFPSMSSSSSIAGPTPSTFISSTSANSLSTSLVSTSTISSITTAIATASITSSVVNPSIGSNESSLQQQNLNGTGIGNGVIPMDTTNSSSGMNSSSISGIKQQQQVHSNESSTSSTNWTKKSVSGTGVHSSIPEHHGVVGHLGVMNNEDVTMTNSKERRSPGNSIGIVNSSTGNNSTNINNNNNSNSNNSNNNNNNNNTSNNCRNNSNNNLTNSTSSGASDILSSNVALPTIATTLGSSSSSSTTSASSNAATVTFTTTPNGIKTELVIASAATVANDNKPFIPSDKDIKDSRSVNEENKMNLNSIGGHKTKAAEMLDGDENPDVSEIKKIRLDSEGSSNPAVIANDMGDSNVENKEKLHPCFVCKAEACPRTRPLKKGRGQQYGISDDIIPTGARVCNPCQCKSVRNRYPNCPLPTCPNPKDRAKRLHNIPTRLFDLAPEIRDPILQEFQIPSSATRCCSACLMRIRRKLDPHSNMNEDDRRTALTDGDESDLSTSSCDERDAVSSDTASAESPNNPPKLQKEDSLQSDSTTGTTIASSGSSNRKATASFEDDRLLPPLGQAPRKQKTQEEYDSSATETADEENENSPANRQSPKAVLHPSQNSSNTGMIPPSMMQNGPQRSSEQSGSGLNVREIVFNFIERSLKTCGPGGPPPKPAPVPLMKSAQNSSLSDSRDVTFVREFRNDMPPLKQQISSSSGPPNLGSNQNIPSQQSSRGPPQGISQGENLATLSVVNSHSHAPQQIIGHPHGITATITPVKTQQPPQPPQSSHEMPTKEEVIYSIRNEPEPQTLDLSIKKPSRDNPPNQVPSSAPNKVQGQHSSSSISMYRGEQNPQVTLSSAGAVSSQNPTYLSYHHPVELNRPSKSPSVYVSQVPVPISMSQQQQAQQSASQQMQQQQVNMGRSQQPSPQISISQHPGVQLQTSKSKGNQKLSPKIHQQSPSPSQMLGSGPKGSITHGTPVNSQQPQILVQSSSTLSPRFDGILRQTPPTGGESNKLGSITQGTPVHLPSHHLQDKQRTVYDYYKGNRQSPAQQNQPPTQPSPVGQQSSPQAQSFVNSPYARSPYGLEQSPQLSSRQIVMHDYITSQQMHGQQSRVGRSDKESPSPRSTALTGSPASIYYSEKDRGRPDYLSRTSPAEHVNSTPSPHRTPPPQRQGVIQRHNTSGSKQPSPSPNRLHMIPHHYPPPGHEAFNSLVDIAVQQPQLPVPQKDEKRASVSISEHPVAGLAHHDFHYRQMARDQMAMQIHQHQQHYRQQQAAAATVVDMQRRQDQYNRERMQQERDRERQERERAAERHNQERLQAERERIERERERERHRERAEEQEREERRRETVRILANSGTSNSPFIPREVPPPGGRGMSDRDRDPYRRNHPVRSSEGLTAASLIDAIIKHSINHGASDPPPTNMNREVSSRQPFFSSREPPQHPQAISVTENNGKSNSPNVTNIDLENERGRQPQVVTKSITLGELTDSIITKDYGPNPIHPFRTPYLVYLEDPMVNAEEWKYRNMRREERDRKVSASSGATGGNGRATTPDERQIIRMAQPSSPRNKFHEMVMSPDGHYYQAQPTGAMTASASVGRPGAPPGSLDRRLQPPGGAGSAPPFALDCYVKSRIAEAMRTEEERRPDDAHLHGLHHERRTPNDPHRQSTPHSKEISSSDGGKTTPSYDDGRRSGGSSAGIPMNAQNNEPHGPPPHSQYPPPPQQQQTPVTTFTTTTYAYPFSALNVPGPPAVAGLVAPGPPPTKSLESSGPSQPQSMPAEPRPLLSAQYEALSDEE